MAETNTNRLSGRVQVLENSVETLARDVHELGRSMERHAEQTRNAIKELATNVSATQKTPWSTLASWASVLLVAVGLLGGLVAYGINTKIDYLSSNMTRHEKLPGHPSMMMYMGVQQEKARAMEEGLKALDTNLQREMRDLDTQARIAVEALDKRLQQEMSLLDNVLKTKLSSLEREIDILREAGTKK